jgi:short-subunit dehydrogenase involved in D-alanine esterification of teichoic acids
MACRDLNKANKAAQTIIEKTQNSKIEVEYLDLADTNSIRKFCDLMNKNLNRLDILINNAG